ncbi:hypothetical protein J7E88_13660 [Streptomyces sp. ISL-10]|uniref:hypothetical protein n=1 Tax=Streptomyces sp. ISL-10 TaxID=2819172 RepID=UPI001BE5C708|nr:hypothetical protein [Streptomyces sp. ISL-10]MBT2366323.1 hypothetical protein [Streptomyces sp. ISL-10]
MRRRRRTARRAPIAPRRERVAPARRDQEPRVAERHVSGKGGGGGRHTVRLPVVRKPAVLVFRTAEPAHVTLPRHAPGKRERGYTLTGGERPVEARVPLARAGDHQVVRFQLTFRDRAQVAWEARTELVDLVPGFDAYTEGRGFDVVRYLGEPGPGVLRHRGRGAFLLQALDWDLKEWVKLAEGNGDGDVELRWPGPGFYQVRAHGTWTLTQIVPEQ